MAASESPYEATPCEPLVGSIYSFKTRSLYPDSLADTQRFAALKIIFVSTDLVAYAVLDGIWSTSPTALDVRGRDVLRQHRFAHTGNVAMLGVNRSWWSLDELDQMSFVGSEPLSPTEADCGDMYRRRAVGIGYGPLSSANNSGEGEWRWANDRDALLAEHAQDQARRDADDAARAERYRTRLKDMTFGQLLSETPLDRWTTSPPFPSEAFTRAARARIRDLCREIQTLGFKPPKAATRAALRRCVEWFNIEDERAEHPIETEEREDLCAALEEIAHAAKQPALAHEIHDWRNW